MIKSPRTLRVVEGNQRFFTIQSDKNLSMMPICLSCAIHLSCRAYESTLTNQQEVEMEVTKCSNYQPTIGFQPPLIGFEDRFNTFRPGLAWARRLRVGNFVGLLNTKTGECFGKAEVVGLDSGDISVMLDNFAYNNHLMLSEKGNHKTLLFGVLKRIYGPRIIAENSQVTVIELRRIYE